MTKKRTEIMTPHLCTVHTLLSHTRLFLSPAQSDTLIFQEADMLFFPYAPLQFFQHFNLLWQNKHSAKLTI